MRIKECPKCGNQFYPSRRDMRFCNVWCRVRFNNEIAKMGRHKMKHSNLAIIRNYRLLKKLLNGAESLVIPLEKLMQKGFDLTSVTSIRRIDGQPHFFLYDISYKKGNELNQIIIKKIN